MEARISLTPVQCEETAASLQLNVFRILLSTDRRKQSCSNINCFIPCRRIFHHNV